MATLEELLQKDGRLVYRTKGVSMEPMLRQNRDLVIIEPAVSRLNRFDVALYKRGEKYVLHRVIRVLNGYYRIRGDNTFVMEQVPYEAVLGVLKSFNRKGKTHTVTERGYRLYVCVWNLLYPLRWLWHQIKRGLKAAAEKLGLLPLLKKVRRRS